MTLSIPALALFTAAAALLALWRPRWAVFLPLVFHVSYRLRSTVPLPGFDLPITLLEGLVIVAVFVGLVSFRGEVWRAVRRLPRFTLLALVLFLLAATVSAALAPHPRTAWGHWKAFVIEPILYVFVLLPLLREERGRRQVLAALLLGGLVSASGSLAAGVHALARPCPLPAPRSLGEVGSPVPCPLTPDFRRLGGLYDVPNSLALVLAPLTAMAIAVRGAADVRLRNLARLSLIVMVPALLLTQSFAGLLAAAGGIAVVLVPQMLSARKAFAGEEMGQGVPRGGRRRALLLLGGFLALGLALTAASGKLRHALAPNAPAQARLQIWAVSLALIRDHPFLGTGLGTFEPAYQEKLRELLQATGNRQQAVGAGTFCPLPSAFCLPLEWVVRDPHNMVLSFWLNFGLLGLLAMGSLVTVAVRRLVVNSQLSTLNFQLASAAALSAALAMGLFDVPYLKNDLALLWWVYLAASVLGPEDAAREAAVTGERPAVGVSVPGAPW